MNFLIFVQQQKMKNFALIFYTFFNFLIQAQTQDTYDALVIFKEDSLSRYNPLEMPLLRFPTKIREVNGKLKYQVPIDTQEKLVYLCHAETPQEEDTVTENLDIYSEAAYCLLDHSRSSNPSQCMKEVKPIFTREEHRNKRKTRCGRKSSHIAHSFGYNYCEFSKEYRSPRVKGIILFIYDICFDTRNRTVVWTKHEIQTGPTLKTPGLPSQQTELEEELNTEPYFLPEDTFLKIAKKYKEQNNKSAYMIPQMLVPKEDFALKIWKKPAIHYLNTAPLWDKLVPLMTAINDGIRKAGVTINLRSYNQDVSNKDDPHYLKIYTRTYSHLSWGKQILNEINFFSKEAFGWSIWCKFVYYRSTNSGVMIYLHNLPDNPPENLDDLQTDNSEAKSRPLLREKECKKTTPCDFKTWLYQRNGVSVTDDLLTYAYCCEVDKKKVKKLFNKDLEGEVGLLNIDEILRENKF